MSSDEKPDPASGTGDQGAGVGIGDDLKAGLGLMLRAAKKAAQNLDPERLEQLGRRALDNEAVAKVGRRATEALDPKNLEDLGRRAAESLDARKLEDLGRRAAENLSPERIEKIAGDAGRELLNVMERVADRIDSVVGRARPPADEPARAEPDPSAEPPPTDGAASEHLPRVRIE